MNAASKLLLAAVIGSLLPACQGKPGGLGGSAGSPVGQAAPPLAAKTIDGDDLSLADLHGQVVLVNVWATWCKPCTKELPELAKLHRERSAQGFSVLGVSVDKRDDLDDVRATVTSYELDYPMLFVPDSRVVAPWKVVGYPTSILVGRDGTIRWRRDGMIHPDDRELAKELDAALAEPTS